MFFLPNCIRHKISPPEDFITQHFQIMRFVIVDGNPQRTVVCQQALDDFQTVTHLSQPDGMFQSVVVMGEGTASVVGRIDKHAFHFAAEFLFEGFQGKQVIAKDKAVIKFGIFATGSGVIALLRIFQKDARFQLGALVFTYPGEFEFLGLHFLITIFLHNFPLLQMIYRHSIPFHP